jgi:hypothetical protein
VEKFMPADRLSTLSSSTADAVALPIVCSGWYWHAPCLCFTSRLGVLTQLASEAEAGGVPVPPTAYDGQCYGISS